MLKGMKAKRQLAAFVALAVGGALAGMPTAQAAQNTTVGTNDARLAPATGTSDSTAYPGISGSDSRLLNSVTDNTLTIGTAGTRNLPVVNGTVSAGGTITTTTAVTGNTLVINSIKLTGNAYGGIGLNIAQVSGAAQTNPNTVKMNDGIVTGSVIGVRSTTGGVANGGVELAGGTLTARTGTGTATDGIAIAGGMGLAAGANLNPERKYPSMFEPIHGSAPDIAGKGIANPLASIWSVSQMLEFLGEREWSQRLLSAIEILLMERRILTADLGGSAKTADIGAAVLEILGR